ncbi:hypothetical protein BHE74_00004612 [Ensete ventricosum]|nr:hypothetical protein BHE74_00004612 [Ensete ventricosum]
MESRYATLITQEQTSARWTVVSGSSESSPSLAEGGGDVKQGKGSNRVDVLGRLLRQGRKKGWPAAIARGSDPDSIHKLGWLAMANVYMKKQNVKIDLNRFRPVLKKALDLLR